MQVIRIVILIFSVLGALDRLFGNKLGLGKEFEKGFQLFSVMTCATLGILIIAPAFGFWLKPALDSFYDVFHTEPSIIPASLLANDMGGTSIALEVCRDDGVGAFNAFVVSSMLGCIVSFTIPFAIGVVKPEQHKDLFFGLLCGISTVPVGCIVAGFICGLGFLRILSDLLPLIVFSVLVCLGLVFVPKVCHRIFSVLGHFMRGLSTLGFIFGIFTLLTKMPIYSEFDSFENAAFICVNSCVTLSGALPFMFVVNKLLNKPLGWLGAKIGINSVSTAGFLSTLVSNAPTMGMMDKMNPKGVVLNSAFLSSAACTVGSHLAFTMAYDESYAMPMMVGKLISGVSAVLLALLLYKKDDGKQNT